MFKRSGRLAMVLLSLIAETPLTDEGGYSGR